MFSYYFRITFVLLNNVCVVFFFSILYVCDMILSMRIMSIETYYAM